MVDREKGAQICLDSGKRLFDDAYLLFEECRYRSSIPMYIFAYEEFGKASYLFLKLINKQSVAEAELRKLLSGRGAHLIKIMLDYERVSKVMYGMGKRGFQSMQAFASQNNLPSSPVDYETALKLHEITYKIVHKFHDIKMAFLYADFFSSKWQTQRAFREDDLKAMCQYLHGHILHPYLAMKSSLFLLSLGVPYGSSNMTPHQSTQFLQNTYVKQLSDLYALYISDKWAAIRHRGRAGLDSVDLKPFP